MKNAEVKVLRGEKQQIEGNLVLKEEKVYVPNNEVLRVEMIQLHHDILVAGYRRKWKTMELVIRNYWWPGIIKDVEKYIEECDMCQRMKNRIEIPTGKLKLSKVAVVAMTSQKTNSNTSNKSQDEY